MTKKSQKGNNLIKDITRRNHHRSFVSVRETIKLYHLDQIVRKNNIREFGKLSNIRFCNNIING